MHRLWLVFFLLLSPMLLHAQAVGEPESEGIIEGVAEKTEEKNVAPKPKEYLKKGYYNHIAKEAPFVGEIPQEFDRMADRYQSEDFQYAESIKDQMSFLDRIMKRFWGFLESLFPQQEVITPDTFYNFLALLGVIMIVYLIYRFALGNKVYNNIKKEKEEGETISFVERNLMQVDLGRYIQEALKQEDYALAVRYQQLRNIQVMSRKGWVEYEHTKTNRELLDTVQNSDLHRDFKYCTNIFDRVWFGSFPLDREEYLRLATAFERFQKTWS